jgi:hypothetical protein
MSSVMARVKRFVREHSSRVEIWDQLAFQSCDLVFELQFPFFHPAQEQLVDISPIGQRIDDFVEFAVLGLEFEDASLNRLGFLAAHDYGLVPTGMSAFYAQSPRIGSARRPAGVAARHRRRRRGPMPGGQLRVNSFTVSAFRS